jgi:hypothetical protein
MKAITRRLDRLAMSRVAISSGPSAAELIMETRRRRLEASGQCFVPSPPVDYTGCRTIADHILRARQASMKRQLAKELTQ